MILVDLNDNLAVEIRDVDLNHIICSSDANDKESAQFYGFLQEYLQRIDYIAIANGQISVSYCDDWVHPNKRAFTVPKMAMRLCNGIHTLLKSDMKSDVFSVQSHDRTHFQLIDKVFTLSDAHIRKSTKVFLNEEHAQHRHAGICVLKWTVVNKSSGWLIRCGSDLAELPHDLVGCVRIARMHKTDTLCLTPVGPKIAQLPLWLDE